MEGFGFAFVVPVDPKHGLQTRRLAVKITALGQETMASDTPIGTVLAPGGTDIADEIGTLAPLHASGALTDAEFSAAKARLLA